MKLKRLTRWWCAVVLLVQLGGCGRTDGPGPRADVGWEPTVKTALDELIEERGKSGAGGYAVFDWDNTVIHGDIGATTVWWMIRNDKVKQPPRGDWAATSRWLTPAAVEELSAACAGLAQPGEPLPTSRSRDCATAIGSLYHRGETAAGQPGFAGWDRWRFKPTAGWQSVLLAGYTPEQARAFGRSAYEEASASPVGTVWQVGALEVDGWLRVRPAMRELMARLRAAGVAVWVVSASPQHVVEAVSAEVDVPHARVVGIRTELDETGRLTPRFTPCGGPEGGEDRLITYVEGKRCWINKAILGVSGVAAFDRQPASRRPVFVAGDATTDVSMLDDATGLALVIDRGHPALRCRALNNPLGIWVLQPPIGYSAPARAPLACSTTACVARDGSPAPCVTPLGVLGDVP